MRNRRSKLLALFPAMVIALLAAPAAGQDVRSAPTPEDERRSLSSQASAFRAINAGKLDDAERHLREAITIDDSNFVFHYNLACVLSLQEKVDDGVAALMAAIERGFVDLRTLRTDGQLAAVRKDERIERLIAAWPTVLDRHLEANLASITALFNDPKTRYETTRDARLRIAVVSAMDPKSTELAHADLARLYDWGLAAVFEDLADPATMGTDPWATVVLPTGRDFGRWLIAAFGRDAAPAFSGIGGSYMHDQKRLVAQDLGATLRHEFFHVLHWRSATRLGQDHPVWIQEGLCSLVEDYDLADGKPENLKPAASWRSNMARRILSAGNMLPINKLSAMRHERFTGTTPLAHYAQARTFFLYLWTTGKLKDWYRTYTTDREHGYRADRSGVKALEHVYGVPSTQIDKDYRAWVRTLPQVAEQSRLGTATLGVDVDPGTGDGPVIAAIPPDSRRERNQARAAGLRIGDVITAIDGRPTRDLNELVRILGEYEAGDEVEVSYRRGRTHGTARVTLTPR
jgi:hypothetical protein